MEVSNLGLMFITRDRVGLNNLVWKEGTCLSKSFKVSTSLVCIIFFLTLVLPIVGQAQSSVPYLEIKNDYIRIIINNLPANAGRFSVGTTGGDPDRLGDENKHLIYGGTEPWTSYTTVRIGNENWVFGNETNRRAGREGLYGRMLVAPTIIDDSLVSKWQLGPVIVTQKLSFARSTTTGLMDSAKIEYELHNTDNVAHLVGVRLMLDTMLGQNDGAPFRINDKGLLTDSVFYKAQMPEFWQAFDSLANPQVMAQGTLSGSSVTTPDRVYLTNWGSLADDLWNFDFQPGRDFMRTGEFELDSAIALFWDQTPLKPGETRNYVSYYGLGGVTIAPGDLSLGVTSPAQITADSHERETFTIVAYIQNTGQGEARNVAATLELPSGLELKTGSARRNLGNLDVNETIQTSWQVIPAWGTSGVQTYEVTVDAINSESNQVKRDIEIVSPANLELRVEGPTALQVAGERLSPAPMEVFVTIRNSGGATAHSLDVRISTPMFKLAPGEVRQKFPGDLKPGEEVKLSWFIDPYGVSGNVPYSVKVISSVGELDAPHNFVSVPAVEPKVWVDSPQKYGSSRIYPGEHFSVSIWATNIKDLQKAMLDIAYNPEVVEIVGRSLDISIGTLFVDQNKGLLDLYTWENPKVSNTSGTVTGIVGDRGQGNSEPRAFGTLITIHFRAKAPGYVDLRLNNVRLFNSRGDVIQAQVKSRDITVEQP